MATDALQFKLSEAVLDELSQSDSREARGKALMRHIDVEIDSFEKWVEKNFGGSLAKFEEAIIRTYLYKKITGEVDGTGDIENLPKVVVDGHPALQ